MTATSAGMTVLSFLVTTGLDPVVHAQLRMDCRIKSGNDEG
ncbi:MAG: hypothetical protein WBF58_23780 [Xanthobacteraceae bacterium]